MNDSMREHDIRRSNRSLREGGEVLLEAVIAFTLLMVVVGGLGQQFAVVTAKLEHEKIATEVLLGPQEPPLVFDDATSNFMTLSASTTPSLSDFLGSLSDFAISRASPTTSVAVALGYLKIDMRTGLVEAVVTPETSVLRRGSRASTCADSIGDSLVDYGGSQLDQMQRYRPSGQDAVPVGAKLYDVKVGGTRYQGYVDYLPFIFLLVCSEPILGPISSTPTSTYTIVPRRLVE